jgi:Kef-type K+ transport system membrane component KefB
LFGAYLAGAWLAYVFSPLSTAVPGLPVDSRAPVLAFKKHIMPMLQSFLSPLFFASIGSALPIRSLGSVDGSSRVVWRGIVYSLLMGFAKVVVGLWMLVWPDPVSGHGWFGRRLSRHPTGEGETNNEVEDSTAASESDPATNFTSRTRSAALVGLAMIARGEIALIVAEIARPLLRINDPQANLEPFAVVIWATLLNTAGGAIFVGLLLKAR